jgi:lipopolysaccharide transport system ATP-binding protein
MNEFSQKGRTVLFVSHNMEAVSGLCKKALLLDEGRLTASGNVKEIISKYAALEKNSH